MDLFKQYEEELSQDVAGFFPTDDEVISQILSVPEHYSANLVVDLGNTAYIYPSLTFSGGCWVQSGVGALIGNGCDLLYANTFCNLHVVGQGIFGSGQLRVAIQTSDTDVSGSYTDPTSGLAQFPTSFSSGGILTLNSGSLGGGTFGAGVSGQFIQSGFSVAAGFQRPFRYARANVLSGSSDFFVGPLSVSFVSQLKTTGSGGGFTYSPTSGTPSV